VYSAKLSTFEANPNSSGPTCIATHLYSLTHCETQNPHQIRKFVSLSHNVVNLPAMNYSLFFRRNQEPSYTDFTRGSLPRRGALVLDDDSAASIAARRRVHGPPYHKWPRSSGTAARKVGRISDLLDGFEYSELVTCVAWLAKKGECNRKQKQAQGSLSNCPISLANISHATRSRRLMVLTLQIM